MTTKRFLVVPGKVISRSDGECHYVGPRQLMELYGVNPGECLILNEDAAREESTDAPKGYTWAHLNSLIHLTPRHDGDYSHFWK